MHKTLRTAALAFGAAALAGWSGGAHTAYTFYNDDGGNGTLSGSYPAFTITGSDDGSGNDDTAFYVQTYAAATTLSFTWQYASLDTGGSVYDPAGWILDGVETQLSVDQQQRLRDRVRRRGPDLRLVRAFAGLDQRRRPAGRQPVPAAASAARARAGRRRVDAGRPRGAVRCDPTTPERLNAQQGGPQRSLPPASRGARGEPARA